MANEIVRYHNDMASVSMPGFTQADHDLFTALCYECKGKGTNKHCIPYDYLKDLAGFKSKDDKRFVRYLDEFTDKLMNLQYRSYRTNGAFKKFNLFQGFTNDPEERTFWIGTTEDFAYILNSDIKSLEDGVLPLLSAGYTSYELRAHNDLKSTYSKMAFRQLKRFKRTGWWHVTIDEFKRLMDIPDSYRMSDIRRRVIKPIMDELPEHFENLELDYEMGGASGRQVQSIKFTFKPQTEKGIWHDDDTMAELKDEYRCPECGEPLFMIIKANGDVFYGHKGGWRTDAPCRQTFGSLDEILGNNGAQKKESRDPKPFKEKERPQIEKSGFNCSECGKPLYKLYNSKGEMFYGHIDGWKKDAVCRKTFSSVAEIRGYSETPTRSDHADYELVERGSSGPEEPKDIYSVFETIKSGLKREE